MPRAITRAVLLGVVAIGCASGTAHAQAEYPTRPVQIIAGAGPGLLDTIARLAADGLTREIGGKFIVVNRPGAAGEVGAHSVAGSEPDGYTLLLTDSGVLTINGLLHELAFDPRTAFAPISLIAKWPLVLAVPGSSPFRSVTDLVAAVREKPGGYFYSSPGPGSGGHIAMELFLSKAGISVTHVPYKGSAAATTAAIAGEVNMLFTNLYVLAPILNSGRLRALGVAGTARLDAIPDVPTITETGFPLEAYAWFGLVAPAKTPSGIVERLSRALNVSLSRPEIQQRMSGFGVNLTGNSPAEFARYIAEERAYWERLLRQAGIVPQNQVPRRTMN